MPLLQNPKLLPKSQVFQEQVTARPEDAGKQERRKTEQTNHDTSFASIRGALNALAICLILMQITILASHRCRDVLVFF